MHVLNIIDRYVACNECIKQKANSASALRIERLNYSSSIMKVFTSEEKTNSPFNKFHSLKARSVNRNFNH